MPLLRIYGGSEVPKGSKNIHDCSRRMRTPVQWGQIITRNLRGETEKYTGVWGSTQLDLINITISSNRVMGYVYICMPTVKVRINNNMHL